MEYLQCQSSQAVILVLGDSISNSNLIALADIECIGVVTAVRIAIRVVHTDTVQNQVGRLDAEGLDGCVLDI